MKLFMWHTGMNSVQTLIGIDARYAVISMADELPNKAFGMLKFLGWYAVISMADELPEKAFRMLKFLGWFSSK
ncbi:hypothetical protein L195_g026354 [Trifolium pratense]|uniref:Uncharacterized protein n=1 Tax=Trifolium pratense TaxID=57577 RepID=A0A2K3NJ29_TRIPR|nr:hypothetical protein L195_g026354 [Trifolium pratense]